MNKRIVYAKTSFYAMMSGFLLIPVMIPLGLYETGRKTAGNVSVLGVSGFLVFVLVMFLKKTRGKSSWRKVFEYFGGSKLRVVGYRGGAWLGMLVGSVLSVGSICPIWPFIAGTEPRGDMGIYGRILFSVILFLLGTGLANFSIAILLFPDAFESYVAD